MKKIIALILTVLVIIGAFSGCGDKKGSDTDSEKTNSSAEQGEKIETVEGISVVSNEINKPDENSNYLVPIDGDVLFSINNVTQSTGTISSDKNGLLLFDISMTVASEMNVEAELRVLKEGKQIVSYSQKDLILPAEDTQIHTCIKTGESELCSGEYTVNFYINGKLISQTTDSI